MVRMPYPLQQETRRIWPQAIIETPVSLGYNVLQRLKYPLEGRESNVDLDERIS